MSWASRRRFAYVAGVFLFFAAIISIPAVILLYKPATCFDGIQNQGETDVDKGGPCVLLDPRMLQPATVLWTRSFRIRANGRGGGIYTSVAYIENINKNAGALNVGYHIGLYNDQNVVLDERSGVVSIMPGTITPVFETGIDTGRSMVTHTYFTFTDTPVWQRASNLATALHVDNTQMTNELSAPRLSADVANAAVADITNPSFVAVLFDTAGNAFSASETALSRIAAGEKQSIVFTWPAPFTSTVGQIDILPLLSPVIDRN